MKTAFAIVDLFAGPGGLAEGFSSIKDADGSRPFRVVLSVEKESPAFETLRLRSFLRQFPNCFPAEYYQFLNGDLADPDWSTLYPAQWQEAKVETLKLELGSRDASRVIDDRLSIITKHHGGNVILIGGPPCQAYSLVGRARNKAVKGYEASKDHRHFLYREYIRILERLRPAAFVMENVKGLLSSSVDGELVFEKVLDDLSRVHNGTYRLVPLAPRSGQLFPGWEPHPPATDFVVRAEKFGIPQARHRVIIVGIRTDVARGLDQIDLAAEVELREVATVRVRDVLKPMPKLRSGLSDLDDDSESWRSAVSRIMRIVSGMKSTLADDKAKAFAQRGRKIGAALARAARVRGRKGGAYAGVGPACPYELKLWLVDRKLQRFPNNESRTHMVADLARYFFASLYGRIAGVSPKAANFPAELAPRHRNWETGKFADRFRVQLWNGPAATVTSHISKDGHYFIHPDPSQCRSLTVREAARLQTFPDNYFFMGNRTQQFVQVGNAVPPLLARKIAEGLHRLLLASVEAAPKRVGGFRREAIHS
jgi:DNA (cytosine-5)-methyltransferase 1